MEKVKKLKTGQVEISREETRTVTFTVKPENVARDVVAAEEAVARREQELEAAKAYLKEIKDLKAKVDKAK